ncbi:MAG: type I restriction enzyme HsdR N-terminal domain-containing protein [Bacteroidota bacterium]
MIDLDLNSYKSFLQTKKEAGKPYIFDPIRKKHLVLQPEELVRQLLIQYLIQELGISSNRIAVEFGIEVNQLKKRCDLLIFDQTTQPFLLVECKSPKVKINQSTFEQIARYNLSLQVPYLLVTNGLTSYCCQIDFEQHQFAYLEQVPIPE